MKRVSAPSSSVSSPTSRREVESSGLKYSAASPASCALAAVLRGEALDDVLQVAAGLLVERVEDLVEVDDRRRRRGRRAWRRRRAPWPAPGAGRQRDVAVRDARQRREPDRRLGALAQRRDRLLDPDARPPPGCRRVSSIDCDRADAPAAHLDVVVGHELARVLEQQRVLGPAAAAEQQQPRGERDDQGEGEDGGGAGDRHSIPSGPWDAPARNWRTNWLSELNSSSAGPDSTIRPFHSTAMYSATRLADMMSCVITT